LEERKEVFGSHLEGYSSGLRGNFKTGSAYYVAQPPSRKKALNGGRNFLLKISRLFVEPNTIELLPETIKRNLYKPLHIIPNIWGKMALVDTKVEVKY